MTNCSYYSARSFKILERVPRLCQLSFGWLSRWCSSCLGVSKTRVQEDTVFWEPLWHVRQPHHPAAQHRACSTEPTHVRPDQPGNAERSNVEARPCPRLSAVSCVQHPADCAQELTQRRCVEDPDSVRLQSGSSASQFWENLNNWMYSAWIIWMGDSFMDKLWDIFEKKKTWRNTYEWRQISAVNYFLLLHRSDTCLLGQRRFCGMLQRQVFRSGCDPIRLIQKWVLQEWFCAVSLIHHRVRLLCRQEMRFLCRSVSKLGRVSGFPAWQCDDDVMIFSVKVDFRLMLNQINNSLPS